MNIYKENKEFCNNQCLVCLIRTEITQYSIENVQIQEIFMKTFNIQLEIHEELPKYLCSSCMIKLNDAAKLLDQIQESLHLFQFYKKPNQGYFRAELMNASLESPSEELDNESTTEKSENDEDNKESNSDDEPLIKWLRIKKERQTKNTSLNNKSTKVSLPLIEQALDEYRKESKKNSQCILCEFKGLNARNLSCHMVFKHKQAKTNWCSSCNKLVENLQVHKKQRTNKIWCKFCYKDITRCHYVEHLKIHAGVEFAYEECCKKFIPLKYVKEHALQHKNEIDFHCHICNKSFKLHKNLEDHILTHGRYKCEICDKNFEIPELLISHFCNRNGNASKRDAELNKLENEKNINNSPLKDINQENNKDPINNIQMEDIKLNLKSDVEIESLTCHICQRTYKTAYKLQKHIEAHMGIFIAKCVYCDKGFSSKADLANHERVHTKEKPFICSSCDKGFASEATLRVHMKQHTGKPEECDLCHKRFSRKSELKLHLQKHRGERPFLCTDCGKSFAQKSHLTCHLTMHSEERPFSCILCNKSFKKKELLKHHIKLHGAKNFKCTICLYECHKKYRLQQHMKMHEGKSSGIKLNQCKLCNRSFSTIQLLHIHMSNAHNVIM